MNTRGKLWRAATRCLRHLVTLSPCHLVILLAGCARDATALPETKQDQPPTVRVTQPERATLQRAVRQPGQIQAFEQTAIFARIAGYVRKWHVDIGDRVRKDDVLAELHVPELVAEHQQKEEMVKQARESYEVAKARVATAAALIQEAQAGLQRAQFNQRRWQLEYDRISKLTVIDTQIKDETWNQLQSAAAAWKEAEAKVESVKAGLRESEAVANKARVDIGAAEADRDRVAALLSYAKLTAPFDGVVTRRHISTGDFVQPATAGKIEPLYVVERRDVMRIVVDVPETDAAWVGKGSKASIRIQALGGQERTGDVMRTSFALDRTSRTLLAEIDLPNPDDRLRSGMYAYATITAAHPNVLTLPASAVVTQGDVTQGYQTFCFVVHDGKARRTLLQVGARDGQRVEVLKKQTPTAKGGEPGSWQDFKGQEQVIVSNLGSISDGQAVTIEVRR